MPFFSLFVSVYLSLIKNSVLTHRLCICAKIINHPEYRQKYAAETTRRLHCCPVHRSYKARLCGNYHLLNDRRSESLFDQRLSLMFPKMDLNTLRKIFKPSTDLYCAATEIELRRYFEQIFHLAPDVGHEMWIEYLRDRAQEVEGLNGHEMLDYLFDPAWILETNHRGHFPYHLDLAVSASSPSVTRRKQSIVHSQAGLLATERDLASVLW